MGEDGVAATTPADGKNRRGKSPLTSAGFASLAAGGMSGGSGRSALDEGHAAGSATINEHYGASTSACDVKTPSALMEEEKRVKSARHPSGAWGDTSYSPLAEVGQEDVKPEDVLCCV